MGHRLQASRSGPLPCLAGALQVLPSDEHHSHTDAEPGGDEEDEGGRRVPHPSDSLTLRPFTVPPVAR